MRSPFLALSVVLCCLASGCAPRPSAPAIALELDFEGTATAAAWIDVAAVPTATGISYEPGVVGQAMRLDGSGASVDVSPVDALPLAEELTIELWVKVADWTNPYKGSALLESIVSHTDDFTIEVVPGTWNFQACLSTGEDKLKLAGGSARLGAWQHVALVLEAESRMARLYVDGQVVAQREARGALRLTPGLPLRIGTWYQKNQAYCGAVDELRIWQRGLSANEIRERCAGANRARS